MKTFNVFTGPTEADPADPEGYRARMARFGPALGASMIGVSVYDMPPGQSHSPYHYEYGDEDVRVVMFSTRNDPSVAVFPDSDKVSIEHGPERERQYKHPVKPGRVTISGGRNDDLAPGTLNSIKQQSQLKDEW